MPGLRCVQIIGAHPRGWAAATAAAVLALADCGKPAPAPEAGAPPAATSSAVTINQVALRRLGMDGFLEWEFEGKQVVAADEKGTQADVTGLKLRLFAGGAPPVVDSTIESPRAKMFPPQARAESEDFLQIQGQSYQVTGWGWDWDGKTDVIHVRRNVQVTFSPEADEAPPVSVGGQTRHRPITIQSERLEIHQQPGQNRFLFSGNVVVTDGEQGRTRAQTLEVLAARPLPAAAPNRRGAPDAPPPRTGGVGRPERIIARGQVEMQQDQLSAWSDEAEITPADELVVLSGTPLVRDRANDMVLEGGRIRWWRGRGDLEVDPRADSSGGPARVRVSLPPLASYQGDGPPPARGPNAPRMLVSGEVLHAHLGEGQRHFVVERAVRVADPSLTVDSAWLEATFRAAAPAEAAPAPGAAGAQVGSLQHILARDRVVIVQPDQRTTTRQAEIFPASGEIKLTGRPQVENYVNKAVITGEEITLLTESQQALVAGTSAQRATLVLPPLPSLTPAGLAAGTQTTVTSDSIIMVRGEETTKFTFTGNVRVDGQDLDLTCQSLEALALNAPAGGPRGAGANPMGGAGGVGEIVQLVARRQVLIEQKDFTARAAVAEIFPRQEVIQEGAPAGANTSPHRFVSLQGDPAGLDGPVRPTVTVPPMQDLGLEGPAPAAPRDPNAPPPPPTVIVSDEQELFTSPTGNQYWFKGNVTVDATTLRATCDEMQVFAAPPAAAGTAAPASSGATIQRILAEGHVRILMDTRTATAGQAEILPGPGTIVLTKQPQVVDTDPQGLPLVIGEQITIRRGDRRAVVGRPGAALSPAQRPVLLLPPINLVKLRPAGDKPKPPAPRGAPPP